MTELFPRQVLTVDVFILETDGSVASVCVNSVMAALLDSGLPCRTTVAAVSVSVMLPPPSAASLQQQQQQEMVLWLDTTAEEESGASPAAGFHTVCVGTFIFANPNSGGGLVGSHLKPTTTCYPPLTTSANGSAAAAPVVSTDVFLSMLQLAEKASPLLFQFFRNCNEPLEQ
ncbi:ribosomal rRNA processing protein 41B [Strigomonas culicis]|nr:ribosomal rRNA processing protein 41B [Strigomonas culicis]|eukprot:EPY31572.1 ribosomal rRNA processing protein 41B [Strigomonas culicis]